MPQKLTCSTATQVLQLWQYITIKFRPFKSDLNYERELFVDTKRPLRLYMNEVSGKCFVQLSLSVSCVVLGHRPRWRWSLYQRYFPFWRLCVITCHPATAGSLWGGWMHLLVIGWSVTWNCFISQYHHLVKSSFRKSTIADVMNISFLVIMWRS